MPSNNAAYLVAKQISPLEVRTAPYTQPGENEIVVKNGAVAVNPLDWVKQAIGDVMFSWMKYPFVMGSDSAGEVVEVGKGVTRFKVGDRVIGHAIGMDSKSNKSSEGAFQEYTVLRTILVSPIPDFLSYEQACVLPLALSTAACGLFMKDFLALPHPTLSPKPTGQTVLIWGGSTSVGCNAIQLATAAGFEVITTASPKNFDYVKKLGAVQAFDYRSPTVVKDIIEALKGKECAGALSIGRGSLKPCVEIVGASKGRKFVAQGSVDMPDPLPTSMLGWAGVGMGMGLSSLSMGLKLKMNGVKSKFVFGTDLMSNEVGSAIYEKFLPDALANGSFVASPEPHIVGKGLEHIQAAMDLNRKGVSAKKVIVTL